MSKFLRYEECPKCSSIGRDTKGDNLAVYADGSKHCFACKYHVFPKHYVRKEDEAIRTEDKAKLPYDFTREVPATALQWLLQYGLPWSYWKETIGYSPSEERLVFTVGTPLQFSIGRYVGNAEEKPRKWYVWGDAHKHCEVFGKGERLCVLVEDLISANKVAATQEDVVAIPLFGTNIFKDVLYFLLNDSLPVVLWLDKDQQLQVKKKALGLQNLLQREVYVVTTDKDPKALSANQIKEALCLT